MWHKNLVSKNILGVKVDFGLSMKDVLSIIEESFLKDGKTHYICTTNAEFIIDAQKNSEFKNIINKSDLSIPDGIGVLFANYYLNRVRDFSNIKKLLWGIWFGLSSIFINYNVGEKISGVDLTEEICKLSNSKRYSIFFLGGWQKDFFGKDIKVPKFDIAEEAAKRIRDTYPNVNIIGATSKFSFKKEDDVKTIEYIKQCMKKVKISELDFLFVAYNHFKQEDWIVRNADKIPAKVSVGVGGTFNYLSANLKRPTSLKFEWFKKIFTQPRKVRRILNAFPVFPIMIYKDAVKPQE